MTASSLAYSIYAFAALGGLGVYLAAPRDGRTQRLPALLIGAFALTGFLVVLLRHYGGSVGVNITFALLAIISVVAAVRVITHPKPVYSVLYFVLVALASATLVLLVGAQFLWFAIIAVYAGAILVTYVFVIMLAQQSDSPALGSMSSSLGYDARAREPLLATAAGFILIAAISGILVKRPWPATPPISSGGHTLEVGYALFVDHALALEIAGVLLLVAMVGAIALARKRIAIDPDLRTDAEPPGDVGRHVKPF